MRPGDATLSPYLCVCVCVAAGCVHHSEDPALVPTTHKDCWFEVVLVRTDTAKLITSGVSGIIATVLHDLFFSDTSFNMATQGLLLDFHGGESLSGYSSTSVAS